MYGTVASRHLVLSWCCQYSKSRLRFKFRKIQIREKGAIRNLIGFRCKQEEKVDKVRVEENKTHVADCNKPLKKNFETLNLTFWTSSAHHRIKGRHSCW